MFFQGLLTKGIKVGELKYVYFKTFYTQTYKNSYMYVHLLSGTFEQKIENPMTKKLFLFNQSKRGGRGGGKDLSVCVVLYIAAKCKYILNFSVYIMDKIIRHMLNRPNLP
jgi:hypothetical protein